MDIKLVKREDIDKLKWDSCVHFANNGSLFGYTWYLDNVAKEWDGLVEGDYLSVMPLLKEQRRFDVQALRHHPLIPKGGLYSVNILSKARVDAFLDALPEEYALTDIRFNERVPASSTAHRCEERHQDYQLLLKADYDTLHGHFSERLRDLLSHEQPRFNATNSLKPEELCDFYRIHHPNAKENHKHAYLRIMYNLMHRGTGFATGVRDDKGELLAADFFAFGHGRMTSLVPTWQDSPFGKEAIRRLYALQIMINAGKPLTLDFNIATGDAGAEQFGAKQTAYRGFRKNTLKGWKSLIINN
jgi:hypothetical protein